MTDTPLFAPDGTGTVSVPIEPSDVRRYSPERLVQRYMDTIVRTCRQIGARPQVHERPMVLSDAEMRSFDPGAARWRPGMLWLVIPVVRDDGESVVQVADLSPE